MESNNKCRSCENSHLDIFLDLGITPIADRLLTAEQLIQTESQYPLEVAYCNECSLVQILETVPPEELFCQDYPYYSSFSPELLTHSRKNVLELIQTRDLGKNSLVLELASNDGYLLKNYVEHKINVLGIDPAEGPANTAKNIGVHTINCFFTVDKAHELKNQGIKADVIHANNVLAHVADTNGFVEGIGILLKEKGVAVIEVPYVKDLIDHCEFDTIYHQHLCYFSLTALNHLFRRHSLYINDVTRLSIHGGSLRISVEKTDNIKDSVKSLLTSEKNSRLDRLDYYLDFSNSVSIVKTKLNDLLTKIKEGGKSIAAYGAAAKGCTLLNSIGIGTDILDFVVDRNIHKHGRYMPGKHLQIFETEKLIKENPDYVLLLPWNFKHEILEQQKEYRKQGGKFIIPIPLPMVI